MFYSVGSTHDLQAFLSPPVRNNTTDSQLFWTDAWKFVYDVLQNSNKMQIKL
jgi:hypothetical protein